MCERKERESQKRELGRVKTRVLLGVCTPVRGAQSRVGLEGFGLNVNILKQEDQV